MWWGSGQDPGGSGSEGPPKESPPNQQLQDLQEQFESQQMLIAQLKGMLKKTEHSSNVSREKVEEYASTLTKMNARAKRGKLRKTEGAKTEEEGSLKPEGLGKKSTSVTPAKEKVNLLRQQLEENRLKLAQRDKNQKGIEEMVNQLKAQLDDSQIIINQSSANIPKIENTSTYSLDLSKEELISHLQSKDKYIEELNNRIQQLQGNVLDLQENVKEKDSVIDARTKAITLLSENLSKKGKNTLDMLDDTKEQMREMQEQFVTMELKMKEENAKTQTELDNKCKEMEELILTNTQLLEDKNKFESSFADLQEKLDTAIIELNNCKLELSTSELKVQDLTRLNQELELSRIEKHDRSPSSSPQRGGKQKAKSWKKSKQKSTESSPDSEHLSRISELELHVEELKSELEKVRLVPKSDENEEVKNLKIQLDTMNKNLIKTKAQYKAKLKELQKKNPTGEVDKLLNVESDNVRLEQRIAELEEEKGNLQLKLVDVDVHKDKDLIADLENRIEEQKMEIENHIRIITILETQITDKSNEISSLRNELANLNHIENAQVCSEITSVQLEEQLDKQAILKKELEESYEDMKKEKDTLLEKIEELDKEKQEINAKLVNYMQENMELIDRLEKLSAEKVSSAESIEIVESLTQQEKLEIEAYHKNLEFTSDKEHIEQTEIDPNSDLNESVSKLTEDSSELLERIELFTVERREVMEKMESLLLEKENLLEKLNKLEEEKTDFVTKYNQLSTEKEQLIQQIQCLPPENDIVDGIRMDSISNTGLIEEYKILIDNQKIEIEQLKLELLTMSEENAQIPIKNNNLTRLSIEKEGLQVLVSSLNDQFFSLHKEYETFLKENQSLKDELKSKSEMVFEKHDEAKEIKHLQEKLEEYSNKITQDAEEIQFLQQTLEDNKNELIHSADYISSLTSELSAKHSELAAVKTEVDHLQNLILQQNDEIEHKNSDCMNHIETIDLLSLQLQELKAAMSENFAELQRYEELNSRIAEADQIIDLKDTEIGQLRKQKTSLEEELKHKDESFNEACQQLKDKCLALESKIQVNTGSLDDIKVPFEVKIQELENECKNLETKHKEHVNKMKKIAANLKKKAATCQELEAKLAGVNEKWENESKEKDKVIENQQILIEENNARLNTFTQQLQEKEGSLSNLQIEYGKIEKDKIRLQEEIAENMSKISSYESEIKNLSNKNDLTQNLLHQIEELQFNYSTTKNALEAKIQEKEMYIENIESENVWIKERIAKLNEGLALVEDRRRSLEQYTLQLGAELEAKSIACEEVSLSENILEKRLESLMHHDQSIENKLKQITLTNQQLAETVEHLNKTNQSLQTKLSDVEIRLREKEHDCEKIFNLESDSLQLREVITSLEHDIKRLHSDYETKLFEKTSEIESMDQELNLQINELNNHRKAAINRCELLDERIQDLVDNEQAILQDLQTFKEKLENVQNDNNKLNDINTQNNLIIEQLKNQLVEGDIHRMHEENLNLQNIITEKNQDLENYMRQNMQLQMSLSDIQSTFELPKEPQDEIKLYQEKIVEQEKINLTLQNQIVNLQEELSQHKEMLRKTAEHNVDDILSTAQQIVETKVQEVPLQKTIVAEVQSSLNQQEGIEELVKKIKTLEFMLYNVEKEKDDAVTQCHSLSNELTRLVYEREGLIGHKRDTNENKDVNVSLIESEIISEMDMLRTGDEKQKLQDLEYSPVETKPVSAGLPVEECLIQPKSAYLCYADKNPPQEEASGWGVEDNLLCASLEGLIVQESDIPITKEEQKTLQQIEFGSVQLPAKTDKKLISEKPVDPKSAYLCYPDDQSSVDIQDAFASEEDGWGWNAEELKLEAKHQLALTSALSAPVIPPEDILKVKIRELEEEKVKLEEDLKAQQLKSAKLIKKLRETKTKNESLTAQLKKSTSDVLDMAIEEELNEQIKALEKELKEIADEKSKERSEKDNLLKRIDMLTGANERMVELKEKQDNEIQMLHFNNRQLSTKLEQLEWGQDSPRKEPPKSTTQDQSQEYEMLTKKVEELNGIVNDLSMDNEEMQLILEEQRKLRLEAEKALSLVPIQENMKTEQEFLQVLEEKQAYERNLLESTNENKLLIEKIQSLQENMKTDELTNNKITDLTNENKMLLDKLSQFCHLNDEDICPKLGSIQDKITELIKQKDIIINRNAINLEKLSDENKHLKELLKNKDSLKSEINSLQEKIQLFQTNNNDLENLLSEKQSIISELNNSLEKLINDKHNLEIKLKEVPCVSENADQMEDVSEKLEIIVREMQDKNKEVAELNKILNLERLEFEQKLSTTLEQLAIEWAERVEQRGSDVAESWKLHLETRESEFAQLEQTLRLELTEIYTKNEALLTENNELQKKVELLLQEKQAASSDNKTEALQDILSERQSEILMLSQQLQEVSVQLEIKNNEIVSLQQIIEAMQKQNDELVDKNKELIKNYEQLENENKDLNKLSKQNKELNNQLQIENQEIEILRQTTDGLKQELTKLRDELHKQKEKYLVSDNQIIELQQDIQNHEIKLQEIIKLIDGSDLENFETSYDRLLYIEEKIQHVIQNLYDLRLVKDQLSNEKSALEESYEQMSASISQNQQTNEKLIGELSILRETARKLQIDLDESTQSRNSDLIQLKELETNHEKQLQTKDSEMNTLREKLADIQNKDEIEKANLQYELQLKISEINNLRLEIDALQTQNHEAMSKEAIEKENLITQLESKISDINELQIKIDELNRLSQEGSTQISELQQVLNQQTQEIAYLKLELDKKTEEYNHVNEELESLIAQQEQPKTPEKHVRFKEPISEVSYESTDSDETSADKAELDLALYMLHQRDVRCEELTVELMQLLEERDTLQLRLSNAIRINEELRGKGTPQKGDRGIPEVFNTPKVTQSTGAIPKSKSSDIVLKATGTELATEAVESDSLEKSNVVEKQVLDNKLSQLRSVGYNRDKTLKDDQEIRFLQQMSLMQQHRDIASRLPPEAAAKLVDASYTLSRDVQSPSKVLLNWLWGKSTPKVNDI